MVALIDLLIVLLPLMYGLAAVNYLIWFVRRDPFAAKFQRHGCWERSVRTRSSFY